MYSTASDKSIQLKSKCIKEGGFKIQSKTYRFIKLWSTLCKMDENYISKIFSVRPKKYLHPDNTIGEKSASVIHYV
jgi:hypothetical protein